jgi:hypothetical protein
MRERTFPPEPELEPEPRFEPDSKPMIMQEASPAASGRTETIPAETVQPPPPAYQPEDLDVPAFMRKRTDVM